MLEAVQAAAGGLSEVAALMSPDSSDTSDNLVDANDVAICTGSEKTFVGAKQWHKMKLVLCVRSTSEFDTVCNVFNEPEEFVLV